MKNATTLTDNMDFAKLQAAKTHIDAAAEMFSEVFESEGAPTDTETVQEEFFVGIGKCYKQIERLLGTVVYNAMFIDLNE